jgi:hypothetical protein
MSASFPLTAMEEFFYWDDRLAYPCDCFVRLRFSGQLDRAAFQSAVPIVLARHPMLRAKIETAVRGRLRWSVVENPQPVIVWEESPIGGSLPPATHLDLRREIGIRFHVRTDADAGDSELTIQFHHACCDAAGIARLIGDLLAVYATACGATTAPLPLLDPALLASRGRFGLTFGKLLRMMPRQLVGLLGAMQFLMRRPAPVIPHEVVANDSPLPKNYPATLHRSLDRETTAGVRNAAKRHGVTPNDLLASDMFLALAQWRSRQKIANEDQWLRMMVPMNLRTDADRLLPAADVVGSVFLDRRGPDFADADRLLSGIHEEMELIKRNQLGFTFVFSLAICRRLMGGLEKKVRADKCSVSCVFTNVGSFFAQSTLPQRDERIVAGNVTVLDMDLVAPIHPYTCVSVAVGLYADRLGVTLHYDPRPMSEAQAAELLDAYLGRIQASIV